MAADALEQPALMTPKAFHLVQLGLARAGDRLVSVGERGTILLSDDNGKHWRQAKVPVSVALTSVTFPDPKKGWAVGHSGVVLNTIDGGETWTKQLDGLAVAKLESDSAKAEADKSPAAQRRLDEAERLVQDGADKPFLSVYFVDGQKGWVTGAYGLLFATDDGGKTWHSLMGKTQNPNGRHLYSLKADGSRLLVVGEQGTVLTSADGGMRFDRMTPPGKGTLFGQLISSSGAWVVYGLKGNAFRSTDGGKRWVRIAMLPISLTAGLRVSSGALILADEAGQLYRSQDDGQHFTPLTVVDPVPITSLVESADGTLILSGLRGVRRIELKNKEAQQ
ncbi:MAG: glycosyl hydrolase [Rhodocyclaceae bacterium]|nr:MAG: glycosyl hydrolase [Rhodocyclaceae bacterium]